MCSGTTIITLLQFPPRLFSTHFFCFPSTLDFLINPGDSFSPSTLFPWWFYPSFFFHLSSVFLTLQFHGGKSDVGCTIALPLLPSLFYLLFTSTLLVMHVDVRPTHTLLLTHMYLLARSLSQMALSLVEECALWYNQQTSHDYS